MPDFPDMKMDMFPDMSLGMKMPDMSVDMKMSDMKISDPFATEPPLSEASTAPSNTGNGVALVSDGDSGSEEMAKEMAKMQAEMEAMMGK